MGRKSDVSLIAIRAQLTHIPPVLNSSTPFYPHSDSHNFGPVALLGFYGIHCWYPGARFKQYQRFEAVSFLTPRVPSTLRAMLLT